MFIQSSWSWVADSVILNETIFLASEHSCFLTVEMTKITLCKYRQSSFSRLREKLQLMAFIVFRCDMHHILMCVRGDHCVNTIVVAVIMIMSIATSTFEHCDGAFCLPVNLKSLCQLTPYSFTYFPNTWVFLRVVTQKNEFIILMLLCSTFIIFQFQNSLLFFLSLAV